MRDLRDPVALGEALLSLPRRGRLSTRYDRNQQQLRRVRRYSSALMSNNPAEHHSKTPQSVGTKIGSPSSQGFSE